MLASSTSFVKRPARTKLEDKLKSEGVSGKVLQAAWGQHSLSVPRHVRTPPRTPLRATECDTLPPPRGDLGWEGTQPSPPPCGTAGREMLGRTGGCDARLVGAMLAAGERLQAGRAWVWMELVDQSHPPQGHASVLVLPAAFCSVSKSTSK